jgi:hypothetical protein
MSSRRPQLYLSIPLVPAGFFQEVLEKNGETADFETSKLSPFTPQPSPEEDTDLNFWGDKVGQLLADSLVKNRENSTFFGHEIGHFNNETQMPTSFWPATYLEDLQYPIFAPQDRVLRRGTDDMARESLHHSRLLHLNPDVRYMIYDFLLPGRLISLPETFNPTELFSLSKAVPALEQEIKAWSAQQITHPVFGAFDPESTVFSLALAPCTAKTSKSFENWANLQVSLMKTIISTPLLSSGKFEPGKHLQLLRLHHSSGISRTLDFLFAGFLDILEGMRGLRRLEIVFPSKDSLDLLHRHSFFKTPRCQHPHSRAPLECCYMVDTTVNNNEQPIWTFGDNIEEIMAALDMIFFALSV